jgi:PAS domain S-box-containing protein
MKRLMHPRVAVVVTASLVAVMTLLLGLLGARGYVTERDDAFRELNRTLGVQTEQLAAALASPAWNIDRPTIVRIIAGMSGSEAIDAIVVEAAGARHQVRRNGSWKLVSYDGAITERTGPLVTQRRMTTFGGENVGTVMVYGTSRFVESALRHSLVMRVLTILLTDLLLTLAVYFVLWSMVLRPIVQIERYASSVRAGGRLPRVTESRFHPLELDSLRTSIESMVGLLEQRYQALQSEMERRIDSEARFRAIFDSVNDAIFIHDGRSGDVLDVNARMTEMFGFSGEEARHIPLEDLSSGMATYTVGNALTRIRAANAGVDQVFDWQSRRKDGSLFWSEVSMRSAIIGGERRVIVLVRDATQRKEMEAALKDEKEFTEMALNTMQELFFVQHRDGRMVRWNRRVTEMFGLSEIDARPFPLRNYVHLDDVQQLDKARAEVFLNGSAVVEIRLARTTTDLRNMRMSGTLMERNGEPYLVATGIDVSEQRRAEAEQQRLRSAIEQSAIEWQLTFDSVETPIVITSAEGVVQRVNQSAAVLAHRTEGDMLNHHLDDLGDGPWHRAAELLRSLGPDGHGRTHIRDTTSREWDVRITPLVPSDVDGQRIIVFWDITRIVALQDSLRRSETMSAMGKLVGGVAHEVRNPLFGISATLDAFNDEMNTPDLIEMASTLRREVERLTRLMRELLDFGKPAEVTRNPETIPDLIGEVISSRQRAAEAAKIGLEQVVTSAVPPVPMDRNRLRQVFENLVDNAMQHSPEGTKITISAREVEGNGRQWVECLVEDQGKGFVPRDLAMVFEPFFTRRDQGTGLGLSIVKKIVEEHEGVVTAANRAEGGAQITVRLPASANDSFAAQPS